jgi:type IV secretory pathway TraG/TraD family ATPase VirD4
MRGSQDLANLVGSISADEVMKLGRDEQILLIEGEVVKCRQVRHYSDRAFVGPVKS